MNKKLKIILKSYSGKDGFALPVALGMGLVMILISVTMVVRAQVDQTTALAQMATAKSLLISEAGIARTQALFQRFQALKSTNYDSTTPIVVDTWSPFVPIAERSKVTSLIGDNIDNPKRWISTEGLGYFKIIKYTIDNEETGTLEVIGTTNKDAATLPFVVKTTNMPQGSTFYLSVKIYKNGLGIAEWQRKEIVEP